MNWNSLDASIAPLDLRSCLISRHGRMEYEHYRNQRTATDIAKINSCTKSVLSALICIAMDLGLVPEAETAAADFFPKLASDPDPRKRDITLEHLLTMSAGFEWTEFGGRNSFPRMTRSPHWVDFVLEQPLAYAPGTRMEYNSGISQMLSTLLTEATGMPTARFAETKLFGPLGIEAYEWETDPQGVHAGGFGLRMRPLDLLKFGQLYLQRGQWDGRQLISPERVERSLRPALPSDSHRQGSYGWHWWSDSYAGDAAPDRASLALPYSFARGYGGQYVYVVPDAEAVVVLTADQGKKKQQPVDVFREHIAPQLAQMSIM
ncbi:serine hydrolase [Cohnella lubricantis]|uniref:Serine hydrolase n=1 Tax=Cohnella lubricantis TaxID=2163172 RepID=A0A841THH1_9BACL|nr:serine hydrolase [Cohnella lubricantis]MBB6678688.1 serine hydrolase [Cohnella lubricantis]MBP2118562.1 CubicO group peptidase (beta-lactamase class C family) [Cohnella lubricantis]